MNALTHIRRRFFYLVGRVRHTRTFFVQNWAAMDTRYARAKRHTRFESKPLSIDSENASLFCRGLRVLWHCRTCRRYRPRIQTVTVLTRGQLMRMRRACQCASVVSLMAFAAMQLPVAVSAQDETKSKGQCTQKWLSPATIAACPSGTVTLSFLIGKDGTTSDLAISESSGNADLDEGAKACAAHWRYKPAMKNGEAVEIRWRAQVHWTSPPECHSPLPAK
jgi:TonB family protein